MPVHPDTPEPLKTALEEMEASVQQFKTNLSYQAPEQHRELWILFQQELAGTINVLYLDLVSEPVEKEPKPAPKLGGEE